MTPDVADSAEATARKAASHPAFRTLARTGYAANGVVHLLIGAIVLAAGAGGGESDQTGAFRAIAEAPLGFVALWVLTVGLAALALWYAVEGVLTSEEDARKRWAKRVGEWAKAIVYAAIGFGAASVALGAGSSGDQGAQNASSTVLSLPGGPVLLGVGGLVIVVIGGAFVVKGVTRSFREKLRMPGGTTGRIVTVLGVVGYVAKGVALAIVGVLIVTAAVQVDPGEAGGLDRAISSLVALPFGPWLVGAAGLGFIAYGIYCFFRARYARL
ncbi:MAG: DUF1206 domain-containing protein [Microbacterium sp.]|uniref:DUF1206 domain-containing protein n=1 Tax=Microbacterium sp. TaxID=51671 RepID=UPI0027241129|nr:DUF1206 domain-containing protein [Microbacterium sp.]MDO8383465.1 DUF1206 domain-containing protein [Microbacterium sp.]|tara:strand:+ start:1333 stop:2145 length:813 start_codon:yes stop_codon:yes gene_type:complete